MLRRPAILIPAAMLCGAGAAFANPQRELLLVVQGTEVQTSGLDPRLYESFPRILVFRDGGLIEVEPGFGLQDTAAGSMFMGQIPTADFAELRTALAAARIGQQGDCTGSFDADLAQGQFYLSWFGAGGRTHSLLVSFLANGPGSPPCSAPMERVFSALGHARFVVVRDPATLFLAVPLVPAPDEGRLPP
jgi:hypothetical protein